MKGSENTNIQNAHSPIPRRNKKPVLENSPDSEKLDKCIKELTKYLRENNKNENSLIKIFSFLSDISKKSKYQIRILDTSHLIQMIKEILLNPKSNLELSKEANKIIMNIAKSDNAQTKLITETCLNFNCLFEIFLINLSTELSTTMLMTFYYLTKNKEILLYLEQASNEMIDEDSKMVNFNDQNEDKNAQVSHLMSKLKLSTITRTFAEQILDDLISTNKKILLEILENLYGFNNAFITKEAIEPLVRCLGDKNNEVVINALKILLFFTKDKAFHNDLLKANFIFRLVRTYKQGIDEMDVVIVKILYDLFDNKNLYEVLFKNNVLLMLSNYLINFEVEKNEKYEEVIKNVFEIFKLINKNTDEENNRAGHSTVQNPLIEDENLQLLIFKKAYSLAAYSKNESSILSCLSLLQIMLSKFSSTLLNSNDAVKSIIELVPPFFKNKKIEIIKYSLSIFEIILNKKSNYFQDIYVQSANQTFSIKSLVHSVINLVNEFSGNYELLSMSCRILVTLSNVTRLQPYFLQEPQITVLKVFNDNLLKTQRNLKYEERELEEKLEEVPRTELNSVKKNNEEQNLNINNGKLMLLEEIIEYPSTKEIKLNTPNIPFNKINNNNIPSPFKLSSNAKFKLGNNVDPLRGVGRKTSGSNNQGMNTGTNGINSTKIEEREKQYLLDVKKSISENIYLLKDSFTVISNLSKTVENLEVLRLKGFLDVITDKLSDNDTETLPYITRCIQGFCQEQSSIDIILRDQIINKILSMYKLYRIEDERNIKTKNDSNIDLGIGGNLSGFQGNKKMSIWATTAKRLEVLKGLKNILESDIKLQRTFIIEKGIEILLDDIVKNTVNSNESISDQLNEMILRVIYVVSCNINKLFLIYFSSDENMNKNDENSIFESSLDDSDSEKEKNNKKKKKNNKPIESFSSSVDNEKEIKLKVDVIKEENNENDEDNKNLNNSVNNEEKDKKKNNNEQDQDNQSTSSKKKLFKIFTEQLSEEKFMNKLTEVGMFDKNSLSTYKELVKIFINLYLNRYYLEYFTFPKNFDKVINIINKIMKKYKENVSNENGYEILKLVIIFLKFICEDEKLIKKFLKEDVITVLISAIIENEFYENIKEEEIEQFYYNFSLVLLRLTEFNGHIEKFKSFPDFFKTLDKLYDINSVNGKIYVISIIRNIIAEKQDFFEELELSKFLNKIVSQKNSLIIFEFVELIKNLVHSRSMCKRMESVFRYLINEIKLPVYSADFKKKMLDLILCLSYENSNIKDYSLQDLLTLVKNFDINITQKTTLLLLMNFSSLSNNFSFLMQDYKEQPGTGAEKNKINLTKKDFVQVVNQLIDSDRFSQILIQRLLINITSIDGIDMSIISNKIMKVLLEILTKSSSLQDNIIIFSLATLVNIINRNVLRFEEINEDNQVNKIKDKLINNDSSLDINGYISGVESNEKLITESYEFTENEKRNKLELNESIENEKESEKERKKIRKKSFINSNRKKSIISLKNKFKNKKSKANGILKKKSIKSFKKSVGIKTINEEIQQNEEESNFKDTGGAEKEDEKQLNDDYRPLPESDKEVFIVDYIIENVPNLIEIITGLFNKESLDISALTIMFCCNLLRKIRFSKYKSMEVQLIKCVEDYIGKEKLFNLQDNSQPLLKTDSGKFLLIAIIKYFVCLSVEEETEFLGNNLQKSSIPNIIMNSLKDYHSNSKKLKQFKIDITDIKENTINFALLENQLTLFNLILLLLKQKNMKYYFTYRSPNETRDYIELFFVEFINNFSVLINNLKKDAEEQNKINNMHKLEMKEETNTNPNNSDNNKIKDIKAEEKSSVSSKKSKTKKSEKIKNEIISEDDGVILKNQTIQNILISGLKILVEYLVDLDFFNKFSEKDNRSLIAKKELNIIFYNKISKFFESILKCIINEPIEFLYEELKGLFIYILYLVLSNVLESKEAENNQGRGSLQSKSGGKANKYLEIKVETNLENDIDLQKWLMKLFIENKKNIQNDFFCLKIFTLFIHSQKFPNIFHEEVKFIKKLLQFFKYNGEDKRKIVLKIESERILNIMSFNFDSHLNLYTEGVYNIFKSNLYIKVETNKKLLKNKSSGGEQICYKEDFVLLVNMILNNNNKEFIKDDIKKILLCIFPSEDLTNSIRVELFNIYLSISLENPNDRQFKEDFDSLFISLYENIKVTFTEMIFLFEKFTKLYQNFSKKFLIVDSVLISIYNDFLIFDKEFPSKPEELVCFLKLLELYLEQNEISEDFEKMFQKFMTQVSRVEVSEKLKDINILNAILNFSFLYFVKYCDKKGFGKINENTNFNNNEEENENELMGSPKKNNYYIKDEESDDYDESSSGAEGVNNKNNTKAMKEINLRIKNELKEKLKDFVYKCKYAQLIDNIIFNTFHLDDLKGIHILSMLLIQDDYKLLLPPLKEIGCKLYNKEFLIGIFKKFLDLKKIDINEFVFSMHLGIVISNVDSNGIECISKIVEIIMKIYEKYLMKYLTNPKLYNTNYNRGNNPENNGDNGAVQTNGGNIDNGGINRDDNNTRNDSSEATITNYFNDTVTSIYFFCDLIKTNELNMEYLAKVLEFLIRIILDIKTYTIEQKEILIRYYQEILLQYKINTEEELFDIHFNFLKKIHKDSSLNFIEHLMFGTILINTKTEVLVARIKDFLNMVTLVCLHNELNMADMDNKKLTNYYKFMKQICLLMKVEAEEKKDDAAANNGKSSADLDTKIKIAFNSIEVYVNKVVNKYSNLIKKDDELTKKFKKLKTIISNNINS